MKREFRSTATDVALVCVCGALLFVLCAGVIGRRTGAAVADTDVILIDAGHGGADGGASAADGTVEKDLNLQVAYPLHDLLTVMGYRTAMTRTTDEMIYTEGTTLRERKVSDMNNRLAMVEQARLTVSIHQNKFSQTQYDGTQVFYAPSNEESLLLAENVREQVVTLLQPNNTRELKKATSDIYLLHRATRPMILVECGFLSNTAELEKLKTETYRQQLALAIAAGVIHTVR